MCVRNAQEGHCLGEPIASCSLLDTRQRNIGVEAKHDASIGSRQPGPLLFLGTMHDFIDYLYM